jgi:hypothetical protein
MSAYILKVFWRPSPQKRQLGGVQRPILHFRGVPKNVSLVWSPWKVGLKGWWLCVYIYIHAWNFIPSWGESQCFWTHKPAIGRTSIFPRPPLTPESLHQYLTPRSKWRCVAIPSCHQKRTQCCCNLPGNPEIVWDWEEISLVQQCAAPSYNKLVSKNRIKYSCKL